MDWIGENPPQQPQEGYKMLEQLKPNKDVLPHLPNHAPTLEKIREEIKDNSCGLLGDFFEGRHFSPLP
ncbi:MAG: hypothetical protein BGO99_01540 [Nitrosospira sp. 56-18]|nr:MAG: hypothetical protein BGO99_01540 [Nitrosospira sp. 56-18]